MKNRRQDREDSEWNSVREREREREREKEVKRQKIELELKAERKMDLCVECKVKMCRNRNWN